MARLWIAAAIRRFALANSGITTKSRQQAGNDGDQTFHDVVADREILKPLAATD